MLSDVFADVQGSPRLLGIPQVLGDGRDLEPPLAAPRIVWVPSSDPYRPPDSVGYVSDVYEGQRVFETSFALRCAGADVHLFTPYNPEGFKQMEKLLHAFLYAMRDSCGPDLNWGRGPARWLSQKEQARRNVWEVVQPIQVFVPVWDAGPAQLLGSVNVTPNPLSPS